MAGKYKKSNPWISLLNTFLLIILLGTFLLMLPVVHHGKSIGFVDALFTSTSAVCVTGLTVVNTSSFNLLGQIIILALIQIGAIGIMTLSSALILFIRGEIDLHKRSLFAKLNDNFTLHTASDILSFIIKFTFIIESIGIIFLFIGFLIQGLSFNDAVYSAVFHSISAFCNAGFSIYDSSMIGMNPLIKYTIMILIILGGIGYYVAYDMILIFREKKRMSLHSKIVIFTSAILIIAGAFSMFFVEAGNLSITDSLFQSISARTAGFNSVDISNTHHLTKFILIVLMFIGASPGSTGGGIKTTTFFIAIVAMFKTLRGETSITVFKRHIPYQVILRSFALVFTYMVVVISATGLLLLVSDYNFLNTVFEVTSALGTAGLTLGISSEIHDFGKIILVICMFLGRVGPSTIAMVMIIKEKQTKIRYPDEKIIQG